MENEIVQIARELRKPAGDAERFSTNGPIRQNRKEFVIRCHDTWKGVHEKAVYKIFTFDAFLQREKSHPTIPMVKEYGEYNRAVWRKVNDAIIWSVFRMQRHIVKRLCLYRRRSFLSDSNDMHAMTTIKVLNTDPLSLAIWNDATSCVDIGDVTYIKDGLAPAPLYIELKEGTVNDAIIELLKNDSAEAREVFAKKYGPKAVKQLSRVVRQSEISEQAIALLQNERGVDPVTGHETQIIDMGVGEERYDDLLNDMLKTALYSSKEIAEKVECLWVLINRTTERQKGVEWVFNTLESKLGRPLHTPKHKWESDRIADLNDGLEVPMAMPILLRHLDAEVIGELIYGNLMGRVHFYFDWEQFAKIVHEEGGTFEWSSEKEARRMQAQDPHMRPLIIRGLVPMIVSNRSKMFLSDPAMVEVYFDGMTPRSIARRFVELGRNIDKGTHKM